MFRPLYIEREKFSGRAHGLSFLIGTCRRRYFLPYRRFDERVEKRMRGKRAGFEFGVELGTEHKWMLGFRQFRYLHEMPAWRLAREYETGILEALDVVGIHLEAVTMTLGNTFFAICFARDSP